jgi:hypothetical protein
VKKFGSVLERKKGAIVPRQKKDNKSKKKADNDLNDFDEFEEESDEEIEAVHQDNFTHNSDAEIEGVDDLVNSPPQIEFVPGNRSLMAKCA